MIVQIIHKDGKVLHIPVTQIVIYTDQGHLGALAYESNGFTIYSDVNDGPAFEKIVNDLRLKALPNGQ